MNATAATAYGTQKVPGVVNWWEAEDGGVRAPCDSRGRAAIRAGVLRRTVVDSDSHHHVLANQIHVRTYHEARRLFKHGRLPKKLVVKRRDRERTCVCGWVGVGWWVASGMVGGGRCVMGDG